MKDRGYTKLKLLYIKDYLEKNSDEDHPVSVEILTDMLAEKGITCERKSVYSDVKALKEYGVDIATVKKPFTGYAVLARDFEVPEIRLLIDAVQAADFISPKKTKELIEKMGTLCSSFQSRALQKQVYIDHRVKCANEEVYYNIDVVSRAIQQKRKISFIYYKRKLRDGEKVIVSDEKEFTVSPYALIWSNDHYYLVSNNEKYDNLMHTRIDRMKKVSITGDRSRDFSEVSEYRNYFDVADYSSKSFNMYSGDTQRLVISCDNSILEEIIDRFGDEGIRADKDEGRFILSSRCVVSEGLASWIMQFGGKVEILEPQRLREDVIKKAEEIFSVYREGKE
ncbi:MAG: WYL domain-containing transcriptional regulator [Ruminococcaceae bacterium]|nr:WYL domain-containing transcriptional regulator [Oscillospiraceae bacterium]